MVIRLLTLLALAPLAGCYGPKLESCTITCSEECPPGWGCAGDGYCHETINEPPCREETLFADARVFDGRVDSSIVLADAMPDSAVDAALFDAMCAPMSLLMNAGWDDSTGTGSGKTVPNWTAAGTGTPAVGDLVRTAAELGNPTQAGGYAARLGGANSTNRDLCQANVTIPVGTQSMTLSGYTWITSDEDPGSTTQFDTLKIRLVFGAGGTTVTELLERSNLDEQLAWTQFNLEIPAEGAPFVGQTVSVCLRAFNDSFLPTIFRVDTLALDAVVCP